jgi:DNA-binding NarL/FixJ family response regulator
MTATAPRGRALPSDLAAPLEEIHQQTHALVAAAQTARAAHDRLSTAVLQALRIADTAPVPIAIRRMVLDPIRAAVEADTTTRAAGKKPAWGTSEAELMLLRLVAAGVSERQIAVQFAVSKSTVQGWLRQLRRRLGAVDRTNLIHLAHVHGLLSEEP